jgi:hypothetical protein
MLQNTVNCVDILYEIAEINISYAAYQAANPDAVADPGSEANGNEANGSEANGSVAMSFLPLLVLF